MFCLFLFVFDIAVAVAVKRLQLSVFFCFGHVGGKTEQGRVCELIPDDGVTEEEATLFDVGYFAFESFYCRSLGFYAVKGDIY
jgi:hypothetical protein